ncbi:Putative osmoprotectant uptake system permease protein YehY [Corynebacterium occultum]|uniref:Osmoprotectant uptake system permease protein YehY n=1 Tax=Corynebacterium occultum TaxID=2675219 RepID=A0A6B8W8F7_9CORY|nr:ABC transporter permease subunit [Corynebacterium occultum]QGU08217.1 Putative osmoprotectant uptake system permease protein YehY [Corynebacterium occultum]
MNWLSQNLDNIGELTLTHLLLTVPAVLLSLLIALPIGWLAHRWQLGGGLILVLVGVIYAIPSLPMFIIVPSVLGIGLRSNATMIIVLTAYGVALLSRTVADAFASVPGETRRAATGIGYSDTRRFFTVDLPLAAPVILAGLRVVVVSTVSLVTVGAVVGIQSLGTLFTDGFQRGIFASVLTGLVLTVALALLLDALCLLAGRILLPWQRADTYRREVLR